MELAVALVLVATRLVALLVTAPVLGSRAVDMRIRIGLALVLSLLAMPLVDYEHVPTQTSSIIPAMLTECLVGTMLGLGVTILFAAAQMVGAVVGQMAGLQITDQIDPALGSPATPVGQLFAVLSMAVFALMQGPELLVTSVLDTFSTVPLGASVETGSLVTLLIQLLQQSFLLTVRGVAPAIASLMISTIVIGLIGRTYPQMNMLQIGLGSNLIVMLLSVFLTLGGCIWLFVDDWTYSIEFIQKAIVPVDLH